MRSFVELYFKQGMDSGGHHQYTNNSACYRIFKARPNASKRLIILPHAGGSTSYFRHWANIADSDLEVVVVQYPGRENRMAEPLISDMDRLVGNLATDLKAILNKPYILFGHSMGGGIACELAMRIQAYRYPPPTQLVVSAVEGPSCHHATEVHKAPKSCLMSLNVLMVRRLISMPFQSC
ncbi:hypothetical protein CKO50_16730 [Pseudoalteromonas sp. HM-SA03]|nr:alpha/beta fold hydrolase [Pseudoalteromonas sp. HM-SA03]PAY00186.1 hypothetical protein CKO50_16730 [Pseudoalteromonas sp. HM-SA03]